MKTILLLVFLSFFKGFEANTCQSQSAQPPDPESGCCGQNARSNKIIAGIYAELEEYPWLILIEHHDKKNETKLMCTGSLISSRYVVTAAHCVGGTSLKSYTPKSIRLGEYNKANGVSSVDCTEVGGFQECTDPPVSIPIESITLHPEFDARVHRNDIALIRLKTPAPYTDFIRPICLPTSDITKGPKEQRLWTAGWAWEDDTVTNNKQHVRIPYVPLEDCMSRYSKARVNLWEKQICAGGEEITEICKGNSGAPLMLEKDNHYELVGAVSFGYSCSARTPETPDVYSNIYAYKDWIRNTIVD